MHMILVAGAALSLSACSTVATVSQCPPWLEAGSIDVEADTEETKRWMFRYETNRIRECKEQE